MSLPEFAVVVWKWKPAPGYRSSYTPDTVHKVRNMVRRNFKRPHRFICVTDDPSGLDSDVEVIHLWDEHANITHPAGPSNPSCYRRLKAFSHEARDMFGPRFVSLDLDSVIVKDMGPCWDRREDFVIWGDTNPTTPYNGSMFLLTAGTRAKVWTTFDPELSPRQTRTDGLFGSDQAWIAKALGPGEARWHKDDGVFSFRNHIMPRGGYLDESARIVLFHGAHDPWGPLPQKLEWVQQHYR